MNKSTTNIIKIQESNKEKIREELKPVITESLKLGLSKKEITEIITELIQENQIESNLKKVNIKTTKKLLSFEPTFRQKSRLFIEQYGNLFMFLDEPPKFYEDFFWTIYLSLNLDGTIKKDLVINRFITNMYGYKHKSDLFNLGIYKKMTVSLRDNLRIFTPYHSLCLKKDFPKGLEIYRIDEYIELSQKLNFSSFSFFKDFCLISLTCIEHFM